MPYSPARNRFYPSYVEDPEPFWAKVDVSDSASCWPWTGHRDARGYGRTTKRSTTAHRVAWEVTHGEIPAGLFVCHRCDNPPCCNPAHLFLGTAGDNARDMAAKGRVRGGGPRRFDRDEARRLLASGLGLRATARILGVSHSSLRKAVTKP
jgi:hypothetical protein